MDNLLKNYDSVEYGDNYKSHILEMYKIYLEMTDRISNRRQSANSFFLSINSALIGFIGYISVREDLKFNWIIALAGIILCYTWYRIVRSYKDLNSGKFRVIHEIEKELPISPYDAEWKTLGEGKDSKLYLPFTNIELKIPIVFGIIHLLTMIISLDWSSFINHVLT